MPHESAAPPATPLYRIGRAPDPLAPPPRQARTGTGRFDDPTGGGYALHAGERRPCFLESLARFRRPLSVIVASERTQPSTFEPDLPTIAGIPRDWLASRRIATFTIGTQGTCWLDLRSPEAHERVRRELASGLHERGYEAYALGDALGQDRRLTQAIAFWARANGFAGIVYPSRYDPTYTCWAIFGGVALVTSSIGQISLDDPDLRAVADLFGLTIAADDNDAGGSGARG